MESRPDAEWFRIQIPFEIRKPDHSKSEIKLDSRDSPTMHMNPFYSSTEIFHKKNQ
jgi:hypothetical protein